MFTTFALLLVPLSAVGRADASVAARPNLLLILADDLGYGDVSCYNDRAKVPTPHIDCLAREGMRFVDAHSPATVCTPTRYSLMTGQMAFRVPRGGTVFTGVGGPSLISPGRLTLPAMLRAQGYATACIGKWHVGLTFFDSDGQPIHGQGVEAVQRVDYSRRIEGGPLDHGFDRFFGTACCPTTDWLYAFIEGDRVPVPPVGKIDKRSLPQHPYANDCREGVIAPNFPLEEMDLVFLKKSREFLESHVRSAAPGQPFFLYHAAQAVHLPSFPADEFQGKTQAGPHGDFIHELDYVVGELLATLDQLGVAENTVVIFTSDNGPETTAVLHMRADYGHDGARPWRGMKRDQWEGGHRVPFLVRWPGLVKPGTTSAQLTSLTDVMATVAAIIGADLPEDAAEDSFSMLPALLGEDSGPLRPYLLQQAFGGPRYLAIRRGNWKYLDHTGSGGNRYDDASPLKPFFFPDTAGGAPGQLYDLETDPGETKNLYFEQPQIVKELKTLLEQSKASGRSRPASPSHHPQRTPSTRPEDDKQSQVTLHSRGLHGYIGFSAARPPAQSEYSAGMGFYSAVWPLIDQPLADFQIGLAGSWIMPDNSDNKDRPLAPERTLARTWKERGPTWSSVFQTVEGGLGYWAGNHFRYGPPKFSMNATPQCYDYEVGSPGWSFFYSNEALPDHRLGIAQLSNRLLIPPDALPFQGNPNGQFLGYAWMALPFTDPVPGNPPTGDQSWTCFLNAANFKGPIAYYIPETWSKIGKLFHDPFLYGRGLDARPATMGGGAMEINTVPRFDALDAQGVLYSRIPKLQFPVDEQGRSVLVQDVTYYSKAALYDAFKVWRDGGPACSGRFDQRGAWKSPLTTKTTRYQQGGQKIRGVERVFDTKVFEDHVWGLQWFENGISPQGVFPQYFQRAGEERVVVAAADVPAETRLQEQQFKLAGPGARYTSPETAAWKRPGPKLGPFQVQLADGSCVTYYWYRFIDQPSFQQYSWSAEKQARLQAFVEKIHGTWPIDRDYMAPLRHGELAALDPALLVTPPQGLEVGYVPIVTEQHAP